MEARKVESGHGWMWIKHGFELFRKSPVLWVVLVIIAALALITIASIPVVGDPLATLLMPVVLAGFMLGCHALQQGEELELVHLFAGFRQHTQQLVTLGGINLVSQLLILGVMMLTGGASLVSVLMNGNPNDQTAVMQAAAGAGLAVIVGMTLYCVLVMAMQFAPALVLFNNAAPIEALKSSLRACLLNILPLSVYGAIMLIFAFAASLPMMLGWVVLLPLIVASTYTAYQDLFPKVKERSEIIEGEVVARDDQTHF
jgi:hypothetical protein